jgi:hypothetical protein
LRNSGTIIPTRRSSVFCHAPALTNLAVAGGFQQCFPHRLHDGQIVGSASSCFDAPPKPLGLVLVIILIDSRDSHVGDGVRSGHCSCLREQCFACCCVLVGSNTSLVPADRLFHRPPRSIQSMHHSIRRLATQTCSSTQIRRHVLLLLLLPHRVTIPELQHRVYCRGVYLAPPSTMGLKPISLIKSILCCNKLHPSKPQKYGLHRVHRIDACENACVQQHTADRMRGETAEITMYVA